MTPNTRLPYEWIDECLAIRELSDTGKSPQAIATLMRIKPSDVELQLGALVEAEAYLADWCQEPDAYEKVADGEQFFADLARRVRKLGPEEQAAARRICWLLFDQRESLGRRVYDYREIAGELSTKAIAGLCETFDLVPVDEEADDLGSDGLVMPQLSGSGEAAALAGFLDAQGDDDDVRQRVTEFCGDMLDAERGQQLRKAALNYARAAHAKLNQIQPDSADPSALAALVQQLHAIVHKAEALLREIEAN
jgi:hypothetical protein